MYFNSILPFSTYLYFSIYIICLSKSKNSPNKNPNPSFDFWYNESKIIRAELTKTRREFHKIPELMLEEYKTSAHIKKKLKEYGLNNYIEGWAKHVITGSPGTGVTVDIGTGHPPCILLRCDIDGLPIQEETGSEFQSEHPNHMHACGHDVHMTWLLGAGNILNKNKDLLNGTVRLMFQSGQEGSGAAKLFVDEGLLTKYPPVEEAFGFHVSTDSPSFALITASNEGVTYAAANDFFVKFIGIGGHISESSKSNHPLQAANSFYNYAYNLQSILSNYENPSLIVISVFRTMNSIPLANPHDVEIWGTFRALSKKKLDLIQQKLDYGCKYISELYNCKCFIRFPSKPISRYYPPYIADSNLTNFVSELIKPISLNQELIVTKRDMGAEDFSYIAEKIPTTFVSIGMGSGKGIDGQNDTDYSTHSPKFTMDERVIPFASALLSHIATQTINEIKNRTFDN